jgi:RecA/RadA recombinase
MSLLDKLQKNTTIKETAILSDSKFFNSQDMIQTAVPMMNVALSGRLDGGLVPGLTLFCGPSKHFKTAFTLLLVKSYMEKYPEAVCLFYDTEFGAPVGYFASFGIDTSRVVHTPITDIEQIKHDIMTQLKSIERDDRVIIVIDSIGNMASRKEVEDAEEGKSVADMTRAKQLKSLFRMVTPHLTLKNIPMVVVNHIYMELGLYPKAIVSGGTGIYLSADNIFIVGRQQQKSSDNEVAGYNFILNVEKSRFVREKSKIPIEVSYSGGIDTWSGLLEVALESGHVVAPKQGWYQKSNDKKSYRKADTHTQDFWEPILKDPTFQKYIKDTYELSVSSLVSQFTDKDVEEEFENA